MKLGPDAGEAIPTLMTDLRGTNTGRAVLSAEIMGHLGDKGRVAQTGEGWCGRKSLIVTIFLDEPPQPNKSINPEIKQEMHISNIRIKAPFCGF